MQAATFGTRGGGILGSAMRANTPCFKSVEGLAAFAAAPDGAQRRGGFAVRTGETFAARRIGHFYHRTRLHQTAPAIHQDERGHDADPNG